MLPEVANFNKNTDLPASYDQATKALAQCVKIDECKTWSDRAAALAEYGRQSNDKRLEIMAQRIRARAIRRCGELLRNIESQKGANQNIRDGGDPNVLTRKQAATDAGLSERQRKQALNVASIDPDDFELQMQDEYTPTITSLANQGRDTKIIHLNPDYPLHLVGRIRDATSAFHQIDLNQAMHNLDQNENDVTALLNELNGLINQALQILEHKK